MSDKHLYPLRQHAERTDVLVNTKNSMTILGSQVHVLLDDIEAAETKIKELEKALVDAEAGRLKAEIKAATTTATRSARKRRGRNPLDASPSVTT